jgi:uncharacterized protein (DUF1330 family)
MARPAPPGQLTRKETAMSGPKELNAALLAEHSDDGPVVMVNLVRFHEQALDGSGSGWDAYVRYSQGFAPLLRQVGGRILWSGRAEGAAYGDLHDGRWSFIVLVWYPSRAAFLATVGSDAYAEANVSREAGVAEHVILAATELYSRFGSERFVLPQGRGDG